MTAAELALELIRLVVQLVGYEAAQKLVLGQGAINAANAAADAAEDLKFGPVGEGNAVPE